MFKLIAVFAVLGLAAAKPSNLYSSVASVGPVAYSSPVVYSGYNSPLVSAPVSYSSPLVSAPVAYTAPVSYSAPAVSYGAPAYSYAAPAVSYSAPAMPVSYSAVEAPVAYSAYSSGYPSYYWKKR